MKRILVDINLYFTRVAVTEDGLLTELIYENNLKGSMVGSIYACRVENTLKGMQAAFVDIGEGKNAYLYFDSPKERPKPGEEFLVQVEKAANGKKGAVVTRKLSFTGKFIVLMPNDGQIGISKKIEDNFERERIKTILKEILPDGYGAIIRTEGSGRDKEEYVSELEVLIDIAKEVMKKGKYLKAPALVSKDASLIERAARELFKEDVDEFIINDEKEFKNILNAFAADMNLAGRIKLHNKNTPIFEDYMVESQAEKAFSKNIWLKSGGFLVIEQTEALVVIDVNTGKYTGKKNLQETILKTNIEAAREAARQIRLRNLSGMIIIDFIDMKIDANKRLLRNELEAALKKDRIKTYVVGMTELGLMQITRQKKRPSIEQQMTTACKNCGGSGRVPTIEWTIIYLRRKVETVLSQTIFNKITISADGRLLFQFEGPNGDYIKYLKENYDACIVLNPIENTPFGFFEIEKEKV